MVESKRVECFYSLMVVISVYVSTLISPCVCAECEVEVSSAWEQLTFIPLGSYVSMNCTYETPTDQSSLEWSIGLPDREVFDSFIDGIRKDILNSRGFYELPAVTDGSVTTIRLSINSTDAKINNTMVRCEDVVSGSSLQETTIIVYEPQQVSLIKARSDTVEVQAITLYWSPPELLNFTDEVSELVQVSYVLQAVPLTSGLPKQSFANIEESFFKYSAPEGAPACEVYNFSVTATLSYLGATYTGAGCSKPSPVISRMLPSLPDITKLESSLNYSLVKQSTTDVILAIDFIVQANVCENSLLTKIELNINGSNSTTSLPIEFQSSKENNIVRVEHELSSDEIYKFSITVSNVIGSVSTNTQQIYTTDLQSISVAQHESDNSIVIQCTFIKGSDSRGCKVVLFNLYNTNTTNVRNLTREMDSLCASTQVTNETFLLSEYDEVYGYDIESDWSTGYVRVHGQILPNESEVLPCTPGAIAISPTHSTMLSVWIKIGVPCFGAVLLLLAAVTVSVCCMVCHRRYKRSRTRSLNLTPESHFQVTRPLDVTEGIPLQSPSLYDDVADLPLKNKTSNSSSNGDQCDLSQTEAKEPFYHVLENPNVPKLSDHLNGHGNGILLGSDSHDQSVPVYQDIADFSSMRTSNQRVIYKRAECRYMNEMNTYEQIPTAGTNV